MAEFINKDQLNVFLKLMRADAAKETSLNENSISYHHWYSRMEAFDDVIEYVCASESRVSEGDF